MGNITKTQLTKNQSLLKKRKRNEPLIVGSADSTVSANHFSAALWGILTWARSVTRNPRHFRFLILIRDKFVGVGLEAAAAARMAVSGRNNKYSKAQERFQ